jgi:hypothetical protein
MDEVKKQALENLVGRRKQKRMDDYAKGLSTLDTREVDVMDRSLSEGDMKVTSPEAREAKVDAYRRARRQLKGLPVEEAVGDTLDYRQLRKQMGKIGKKGLKAVPLVGSLAGLMGADDASAALPILGDAEEVGESRELENELLGRARYMQSPAAKDRLRKLAELKK